MHKITSHRHTKGALVAFALMLAPLAAMSQAASPVGLWKSIDDVTGKPRGLVRITESGGVLQGRIERAFPAPGEDPSPKCVKCSGANQNAPLVGLVIMSGLRQSGDEYAGGEILDADSGSIYRSQVKLLDHGKKLSVRGYIGTPLLGRTQVWIREE